MTMADLGRGFLGHGVGAYLGMDAASTQGALSNLALHPLKLTQVCVRTRAHLGVKMAGSVGSWRDPGHMGGAALCQCAQSRRKSQSSRLQAYQLLPSSPLWVCRGGAEPPAWRSSERGPGLRVGAAFCGGHPPTAPPTYAMGILRCVAVPCSRGSRRGCHRGGGITGTGAPSVPTAPNSPHQRAHWRRRGSSHQPAARLPDRASVSMGVTGASGFPCCSKASVDIMETQGDVNQYQLQAAQEEDEMELEKELLELEPSHKADLDPDLDPEPELEAKPEPEALLPSALCPALTLEPKEELNMGPNLKVADLESCSEDPEQQGYRIECLPRYMERLMQQDMSQWSVRSNSSYLSSTEEDQVYPDHRSIRVQTSKHLFRADKLIQASEHSLQRAISMQPRKKSMSETTSCSDQELVFKDTLCSEKQLQNPSPQPALPATGSQQPPSPCLSSSNLSPGLSLAELINFATSLAMASSGKVDLPNLEHMIKDPPKKVMEPSTEPAVDPTTQPAIEKPEREEPTEETQPAMEKPEREEPTEELEKPLEAGEPQKAWKQGDENVPCPSFDFSKPGDQEGHHRRGSESSPALNHVP
uniref:Spermatogenesis associated 32 n=1 Tax=Equus asinus TaxID=9793 RepID=A0A8C4LZ37_EQUAS